MEYSSAKNGIVSGRKYNHKKQERDSNVDKMRSFVHYIWIVGKNCFMKSWERR